MNFQKHHIVIIFLALIHVVGVGGVLLLGPEMMRLTPLNLLISAAVLVYFHPERNWRFWIYTSTVLVSGFIIEWIGVKTGLVFGHYYYGKNLGLLLFDIPLIIGVNWLLLSYSSSILAQRVMLYFSLSASVIHQSLLASFLMVLVDMFIEPVASACGFWFWKDGSIPIQNFVAWFVFSFAFNYLFARLKISSKNIIAPFLFVIQLLFFVAIFLFR